MTPPAPTTFRTLAALLTIAAIGCGKPSGGERVHGRVSYRGETIGKGSVTFFPASGRPVTAVLSGAGDYVTLLPPGDYDVIVNVGVELPAGWKEGDPVPKQKFELPARYSTRARSSLKATVDAGHEEPIDFELE